MTTEIQGYINELKDIDNEIKDFKINLKKLNTRKKFLETEILKYLEAKDQPGVKYKGVAVIAEQKERRGRKKKGDKIEDGKSILRDYGIEETDEVLEKIINAMKGDITNIKSIKLMKDTKIN